MGERPWKPSKEQLEAADGSQVPDVVDHGLRVLFCGINPGLYSGAVGHHFARPGNRFWPALHRSGFTPRELSPFEERELLDHGLGVTNVVNRPTATASEVSDEELRRGARSLRGKVGHWKPACLAVVGLGAYRTGFDRPDADVGLQDRTIGDTPIWLLPNTSGLNAHYRLADLVDLFVELRRHVEA